MADTPDNIASKIQVSLLDTIGRTVVEDTEKDLASRSDWDKKRVNWLKLFSGTRDPKSFPWEDCSNVHIPLMGMSCLQFQARSYEALLPPKEYAKCWSTDGKSIDAAARSQKYLNWQLMEQMEEWEEEMDITLLQTALNGSAYKKTYFDHILKRPASRYISVDGFITPYYCRRIEDSPRKTHAYPMSLSDIRKNGQSGAFIEYDFKVASSDQYTASPELKTLNQSIIGINDDDEEKQFRMLLEQHRGLDLNGDGINEEYIVTVDWESGRTLRIDLRESYNNFLGVQTDEYFTCYTFIPNPESHYGYGFGHLLEGLNESANSIINQLIDAGTLANTQSGLVNRRSGLKTGEIKVAAGKFTNVDISGDDIRKAIYMFDFKEPSNTLFVLLGMLEGYAQKISSVSDALIGKMPPSDTTATTMLAVMEQGLKVFSTIHKRLHRSFRKELKKLFRLNSLYLDEQVYFYVQDSTSQEIKTLESGRADFLNTIDVIPVSDPMITSRAEKLIKSKQAYEIGIGNPLIANNPQAVYHLSKNFFEALEVPNIDSFLQPPQPPPPPPDLSPIEENALFLQEKYTAPVMSQDHVMHLEVHESFLNSPWAERLPTQGKKQAQIHIQETNSMLYMANQQKALEIVNQARMAMGGGNAEVQPGGMGGMALDANYARMLEDIGTARK